MLDPTLIEKALALTGKTLDDMFWWMTGWYENEYWELPFEDKFSMAEFCYYLLSPEFIEKYDWIIHTSRYFWEAIYEYQKGNKEPLTNLLSKL